MKETLGIGMVGCGTVGSGVAELLIAESERLAARSGRPLRLHRIFVRDPEKARPAVLPRALFTTDVSALLNDPHVHVVIELMGGVDLARKVVLGALEAGKDVVTANKALLASYGQEIFAVARRHARAVAFEASVAGGVPIISALTQGLAANQIVAMQGILNGTCNYILTGMTDSGRTYKDCLREAQERGLAEADPTLDVDGSDAAHKLAILAQIAFGVTVKLEDISRRGIQDISDLDVRFAGELGYTIKLLAETWLGDDLLALHVSPVLLRKTAPLALVRGSYNAIHVVGDVVGDTLYYGRGAGQKPTASAVLADVLDLAVARESRVFQTARLCVDARPVPRLRSAGSVRSRFYFRACVADQPGVLAEVARILAEHHISIASVIQHESPDEEEGQRVQLVIMTHTAPTGQLRDAVAQIDRLAFLFGPSVFFPVAD